MQLSAAGLLGNVEWFDLKSSKTEQVYRIYVALPAVPQPKESYPAFVMTDANLLFGTATEQLALRTLTGELEPAILIGIGYPVQAPLEALSIRMTDFSPGAATDALRAFVLDQLLPEVQARYPIDTSRLTLFGFSLGGLFALNVLFNGSGEFQTFAAASPSIWLDPDIADLPGPDQPFNLSVSVGGLEESVEHVSLPQGVTYGQMAAQIEEAKMVGNARAMFEKLRASSLLAKSEFLLLEGATHSSAPAAAIASALAFSHSKL